MIRINIQVVILLIGFLSASIGAKEMQIKSTFSKKQSLLTQKFMKKKKVSILKYKEGRVIVKYKPGLSTSKIRSLSSSMGFNIAKIYTKISKKRTILVLKSSKTTQEMIKILQSDSRVESVSPDYTRQLDTLPNDPDFSQLWGLHNLGQDNGTVDADIDAEEAWNMSTGSADVVTAVFDTGIDYRHPDLKDNVWVNLNEIAGDGIDNDENGYIDDIYGYDFAADDNGNNDNNPLDIDGHGTHVSGTIGAKGDDNYGISGINWNASIMTLKVFSPNLLASDSDILEAIDYVLEMKLRGVNIVAINASYGGSGGTQDDPMNSAIKELGRQGIIFCAAAGNDGLDNDSSPHFPSSYDASNIISVAATDRNDALSSFSNYGITSVDLSAPGSAIYSTQPGAFASDYEPNSGDSYFVDMDGSEMWNTSSSDDTTWQQTTENTHSNPYSLTDSLSGEYLNNQQKDISPQISIDLTGLANENLTFGFWAKIDLEEGYDYLKIYFSNDGGLNWTLMQSYDGISQPMKAYAIPIPNEFQTNNFLYKFSLETDSSITYDGVFIDDIGIGFGAMSYVAGGYASWNGTSMATPHVTGSISLLANVYPNETVGQRKARILDNVDTLSFLNDKVLTSGRLNLNNAVTFGICLEGYYHKQGTNICIPGTSENLQPLGENSCAVGMRRVQGSNTCSSGVEVGNEGVFLPSCTEGEYAKQGTTICESVSTL